MSNKFSESQYQEIIKVWDNEGTFNSAFKAVIKLLDGLDTYAYEEALALANPRSREWAHELYVVKELKYYWTSLKKDEYGAYWYLMRDVAVIMMGDTRHFSSDEQLTESEVREWGYDPDKFTRQEV